MSIQNFQEACVRKLGPGCSGDHEELLRAVLGLNEKAGAVARVIREVSFCHKGEPALAVEQAAALQKSVADTCFWLAVVCAKTDLNLGDFLDERKP